MDIPKTTSDFEKVVRSIMATDKPNSIVNINLLNRDYLLEKSRSMITGRLEKDKWGYLSKIKDGLRRVNYFKDAVESSVFGTNSSNEVFNLIIESMVHDGLVEIYGNKLKLK